MNIDTINEALSKELCTEIDLSDPIELLDDSFFFDKHGECRDWWTDFPVVPAGFCIWAPAKKYKNEAFRAARLLRRRSRNRLNTVSKSQPTAMKTVKRDNRTVTVVFDDAVKPCQ
jgi:hypothetical protein